MSAQEAIKLAKLEKKRKEMMASLASQTDSFAAQKEDLQASRNRTGSDRFTSKTDDVADTLKKSTYGLVQLSDFKETREKLEEMARKEAAGALEIKEEERKIKKKKKDKGKVKLSFDDDEVGGDETSALKKKKSTGSSAEDSDTPAAKRAKLGKNPTVDTYFLPDREREEAERKERDELRKKWLKMQDDMKQEPIEITYSYWDGSGHRKVVQCKKGDTIAQFLEKCRQQFPELRSISVDNMMYIKEDLIIPHHYTFSPTDHHIFPADDFIVNKYRGKSGPMFNFDVHDDVRLTHDAAIEKDEVCILIVDSVGEDVGTDEIVGGQSHAGKVIERSWYNRNKHIFPASRWELFNPEVVRERYTIHGE
ncbi:SPOSA6832_00554 [Sporobolomyces salmonicolor]|uniref:SPOSA6832_00554-mRNA-1:cds n=1 Tax=Sporidiobolus salmonicolor TaxID=5005 RepID=A0A0D6EHK3_SPOSA|nr:SPOSA6832_00554 [Sporobolomyces salmonicolor]